MPNGSEHSTRVVVDLVGEAVHGLLVDSRFVERPFLPGGEHNMYELAFAAASLGFDVELRGWLDRPTFDRLATATSAAPRVGLDARLPQPGELVIVPEGWRDPLEYTRLLLSPARLAVYLLAPPGLFGWPFTGPDWTLPDPLTVPLDAVARPEYFQAMHATGAALLTHSPGIRAVAEAAAVPCAFVGTGRPAVPTPPPERERSLDAVGLLANRWAPLVRQVAGELRDLTVELVDQAPNETILERFAAARVLIWPSRVEGHATIPWEARSMGCVPVALSSNRFAVGLSEDNGAVVVDRVEEIAPAVRALLADPDRWSELSARGMRTAPEEVRWEDYVARVADFLNSVSVRGPELDAHAGMGAALRTWIDEARSTIEELAGELDKVRQNRDALHYQAAHYRQALEDLERRREIRIARRLGKLARKEA